MASQAAPAQKVNASQPNPTFGDNPPAFSFSDKPMPFSFSAASQAAPAQKVADKPVTNKRPAVAMVQTDACKSYRFINGTIVSVDRKYVEYVKKSDDGLLVKNVVITMPIIIGLEYNVSEEILIINYKLKSVESAVLRCHISEYTFIKDSMGSVI